MHCTTVRTLAALYYEKTADSQSITTFYSLLSVEKEQRRWFKLDVFYFWRMKQVVRCRRFDASPVCVHSYERRAIFLQHGSPCKTGLLCSVLCTCNVDACQKSNHDLNGRRRESREPKNSRQMMMRSTSPSGNTTGQSVYLPIDLYS
jgi:hypothetical protein